MITLKNIADYIEGNLKYLGARFGLEPQHIQEQILWRAKHCPPSCRKTGECYACGCDWPQKLYLNSPCNKDVVLPKLMSKEKWEQYKLKMNEQNTTVS